MFSLTLTSIENKRYHCSSWWIEQSANFSVVAFCDIQQGVCVMLCRGLGLKGRYNIGSYDYAYFLKQPTCECFIQLNT